MTKIHILPECSEYHILIAIQIKFIPCDIWLRHHLFAVFTNMVIDITNNLMGFRVPCIEIPTHSKKIAGFIAHSTFKQRINVFGVILTERRTQCLENITATENSDNHFEQMSSNSESTRSHSYESTKFPNLKNCELVNFDHTGGSSRPRIPQVAARLASRSCRAPVEVLSISDVKQSSVRNPARMGVTDSYNNKRLGIEAICVTGFTASNILVVTSENPKQMIITLNEIRCKIVNCKEISHTVFRDFPAKLREFNLGAKEEENVVQKQALAVWQENPGTPCVYQYPRFFAKRFESLNTNEIKVPKSPFHREKERTKANDSIKPFILPSSDNN
ncbi:hypothetical protein WN51_09568 [Melipona quadrifasciata]|uniref:Uncharacterized protein n=1 Tax=Melipona quadrifasciata TaxID=166423 RepID=A0A0M9A8T0_9HYME|nr:hypothetical protein WN51_09568 [Melipona quadrifasciata]